MFLIEYERGKFVNGSIINWINIRNNTVNFTVTGDGESTFAVNPCYQKQFVNNLQAINSNISNIEKHYHEVTEGNNHENININTSTNISINISR